MDGQLIDNVNQGNIYEQDGLNTVISSGGVKKRNEEKRRQSTFGDDMNSTKLTHHDVD